MSTTSDRESRHGSSSSRRGAAAAAGGGSSKSNPTNHMESSVTRLLVATKMLLEGLNQWAQGRKNEEQVSDIYVRLGNDFNTAKVAFSSYGIDMSDLLSVPDDLRTCLETLLSLDASPAVLDQHLPRIREIIIALLQGLKRKQAQYKELLMSQRRQRSGSSASSGQVADGERAEPHHRSSRASERSVKSSARDSGTPAYDPELSARANAASSHHNRTPSSRSVTSSTMHRSSPSQSSSHSVGSPKTAAFDTTALPDARVRRSQGASSGHGQPVNTAAGKAQTHRPPGEATLSKHTLSDPPVAHSSSRAQSGRSDGGEGEGVPNASPMTVVTGSTPPPSGSATPTHTPAPAASSSSAPSPSSTLRVSRSPHSASALERRASKRFSAYTFNKMGAGGLGGAAAGSGALDRRASRLLSGMGLGGGMSAIASVADGATGDPNVSGTTSTPRRSALDRTRADLGSASPGGRTGSPIGGAIRRSGSRQLASQVPPVPNIPSNLTPPSESPEGSPSIEPSSLFPAETRRGSGLPRQEAGKDSASAALHADSTGSELSPADSDAPVPPLPTASERAALNAAQDAARTRSGATHTARSPSIGVTPAGASVMTAPPSPAGTPDVVSVYLQLGRQVKKTQLDAHALSFGNLRMAFIDRFQYSPGLEDFPAIYVRDEKAGVMYELEDLADVRDGAVLGLNIEPLDQVKQHIDLTMASLTREIKELRGMIADKRSSSAVQQTTRQDVGSRRQSMLADGVASPPRPSEKQFAAVAQRVAQMHRSDSLPEQARAAHSIAAAAGDSAVFAKNLQRQFDELQDLRRDLGIVRQTYTDFTTETKAALGALRTGAANFRQLAGKPLSESRATIEAGKLRLDSGSQELLTKIEELQDIIDDLNTDVTGRKMRPKQQQIKQITTDIAATQKNLEELETFISSIKAPWKKTWGEELQLIVDEQEFLNHQESLLNDLREDHKELRATFENIDRLVKLRQNQAAVGTSSRRLREYGPNHPDAVTDGQSALETVMLEVRGVDVDPAKRLRAIAQAEKQREREMQSRTDEFAEELSGFVEGKMLRKTGGAEEAERIRKRRDESTMRAMFSGGAIGGGVAAGATALSPRSTGSQEIEDSEVTTSEEESDESEGEEDS